MDICADDFAELIATLDLKRAVLSDVYSFRKESFGFDSPFDTSGRTDFPVRAEVSKHEHVAKAIAETKRFSLNQYNCIVTWRGSLKEGASQEFC